MKLSPETKDRFRDHFGRPPHHTWSEEKVLEEISKNSKGAEPVPPKKEETPANKEPEKKKELKPVKATLFIPLHISGDEKTAARIVKREDWTENDTKAYKESYKDRLKKAMKQLK